MLLQRGYRSYQLRLAYQLADVTNENFSVSYLNIATIILIYDFALRTKTLQTWVQRTGTYRYNITKTTSTSVARLIPPWARFSVWSTKKTNVFKLCLGITDNVSELWVEIATLLLVCSLRCVMSIMPKQGYFRGTNNLPRLYMTSIIYY